MHPRLAAATALLGRLALVVGCGTLLLLTAPGTALALDVHHILPEPGAVLAAPPDHLEIMFDEVLDTGHVAVGISPDATNRPVTLPALVVDGNVVVQPLPPLPNGPYTAGFRVLGADGHVYQASFGFTVDARSTSPAPATSDHVNWLIPAVGAGLAVPAAVLARFRRRRETAG